MLTPSAPITDCRAPLAQLVLQGSITQTQADAVEHQAGTGSINPKELVPSGVVTDAQMHVVADTIDAGKAAG
jgi:hypothetical protein